MQYDKTLLMAIIVNNRRNNVALLFFSRKSYINDTFSHLTYENKSSCYIVEFCNSLGLTIRFYKITLGLWCVLRVLDYVKFWLFLLEILPKIKLIASVSAIL